MYLSRIELDKTSRNVRLALASPQRMHAIIAGCFDDLEVKQRSLWRIDTIDENTYLLVFSMDIPDFNSLADQFAINDDSKIITKAYDSFLNGFECGETLRFRITANPSISKKNNTDPNNRGRVLGHITVDQQKKWLEERSLKNGFELLSFDIVSRGEREFERGSGIVTFTVASYEGLIKITDIKLFTYALAHGIGREKAYGCGLMTVARL
ncbi:MAG: type I-E CRISPR-associated protein Cas6/Cse3/CasE [Coriobacteriia bacterium]|nr:type I-E CRISPR-associated protein Cas6/Cse3/CasE [Coriobacteriia bacterium]